VGVAFPVSLDLVSVESGRDRCETLWAAEFIAEVEEAVDLAVVVFGYFHDLSSSLGAPSPRS